MARTRRNPQSPSPIGNSSTQTSSQTLNAVNFSPNSKNLGNSERICNVKIKRLQSLLASVNRKNALASAMKGHEVVPETENHHLASEIQVPRTGLVST